MYQFPDTAGLERAKRDIEEPIYQCSSMGINKVLDVLRISAGTIGHPRWDLYIINVFTLVRNAYKNNISQHDVDKTVDVDVDSLIQFIGAYMSYQRTTPATVLFYLPDYSAIPKDLLREHTGNKAAVDNLYTKLKTKLPVNSTKRMVELTEDPLVKKFLLVTSGNTFPHKEIPRYLNEIYGGKRITGSLGTLLLSHCVIDLHISAYVSGVELIESFSGNIIPSNLFGSKLTKEVEMPFLPVTHRLFGDDDHIIPLVKGRQKKNMIDIIRKDHWGVMTERQIVSDILMKIPGISELELRRLKL